MTDSLDDFFAKKDKKMGKDKGRTGVLSAEALVKELEEGSKQTEYPVRKDKISAAIEMLGLDADDADWRDFEDVERRDYTGLKVKEMSLQDQNEEDHRRLSQEVAEPVIESTPWRIKEAETTSAPNQPTSGESEEVKKDVVTPAAPAEEEKSAKPQKYVPPSQRNTSGGEFKVLEPVRLSKTRTTGARQGPIPDIQDESAFPSLG